MTRETVSRAPGAETEPHLHIVADYAQVSRLAADVVTRIVKEHPTAAITMPTGETPRGMYEELARRIRDGEIDFSGVHLFCLDDYLGKGIEDETSLTAWLSGVFLEPANLDPAQVHYVPSQAADPIRAAAEYEAEIERHGGLKLAVVGLGKNGHVGFNEPGSAIDSRTRVVDLTDESRNQNAAYYEGDNAIPAQAMTMGMGTILDADLIVLIVSGEAKAGILKAALQGPMSPDIPGSFLRKVGERLIAIVDTAAASELA
jgi:glucosamine-6-phosphate deaminase